MSSAAGRQVDYDYVVVGSGAGGGTLAARLAEEGQRVILLEAGGDPRELAGGDPAYPNEDRARDDYDVPVFHAFASENEAYRWDHFVRHYESDAQQERDCKYYKEWNGKPVDGVLYPRSGTLGGCTAHNAQIFVYPHNDDWNGIAELTRDPSWRAEAMRAHFERLESCHHRPLMRFLRLLGYNPTRHGWRGWLRTEKAVPEEVIGDKKLIATIFKSVYEAFKNLGQKADRIRWFLQGRADPNDWRLVRDNAIGIRYPPLTHHKHQRMGTRERLRDVAQRFPDRLRIELDALATKVILDENRRAVGVEYRKGARLYRACAKPSAEEGEKREVYAACEVILAGGAFNTPQLLMLSGIGPREVLERFEIPVLVELPGVGQNLQDRYEVGVVNRMGFEEWEVLKGAKFAKGDPQYAEWRRRRKGVYATNGAVLAVIKKSGSARPLPDLFCFALLGPFKGYFPGYSALYPKNLNCLTWAIVKAHTNNRRGEVTLRSKDPLDTPLVNFRYFEEGSPGWEEDLDSVVDGIEFVRELTAPLKEKGIIAAEEVPGDAVQGEALRTFVRDNAWGHHASCSCAIGPREEGGVLSSDFKVHGTQGLRVVDASVFPRIPGFFIVSAIYMIAEKAASVILAAKGRK